MRFLLKVKFDTATANAAIKEGRLGDIIKSILEDLKPEAAYFVAEDGKRTALIFLDMDDPSQLPAVGEPWFLAFNASIEVVPAMTGEDLAKAGPAIEAAVKKYG